MRVRALFWVAAGLLLLPLLTHPAVAELDFPVLTGRVVDNAHLLPLEQEARLARRLKEHEAATSNQVVVVTLPTLQGVTIEEYGLQLGRHWGIGRKARDNGVLLIVAPNERKVRIEVGYGLEGDLPDATAKVIIEQYILPVFRKGDYASGIVLGVDKILAAIEGSYEPQSGPWKLLNSSLPAVILVIVVLIILKLYASGVWQSDPPPSRKDDILDEHNSRRRGYRSRGFGGGSRGGFSGGGGSFGGGGSSGSW